MINLTGEPWIYKTPHHPDYKRDRHERMVNVGLSTSAAPTYFEALSNGGYVMVDGGLWANNPVMNAVVDALACYDVERRQVQVLSLGCGETSFKVDEKLARGGLVKVAEYGHQGCDARTVAQRIGTDVSVGRQGQGHAPRRRKAPRRSDWTTSPAPAKNCPSWPGRWSKDPVARSKGSFSGTSSTIRAVPDRCRRLIPDGSTASSPSAEPRIGDYTNSS